MINRYLPKHETISVGPYAAVPVALSSRKDTDPCKGCWFSRRGLCANPYPNLCKKEFRYKRGQLNDTLIDINGVGWVLEKANDPTRGLVPRCNTIPGYSRPLKTQEFGK